MPQFLPYQIAKETNEELFNAEILNPYRNACRFVDDYDVFVHVHNCNGFVGHWYFMSEIQTYALMTNDKYAMFTRLIRYI